MTLHEPPSGTGVDPSRQSSEPVEDTQLLCNMARCVTQVLLTGPLVKVMPSPCEDGPRNSRSVKSHWLSPAPSMRFSASRVNAFVSHVAISVADIVIRLHCSAHPSETETRPPDTSCQ